MKSKRTVSRKCIGCGNIVGKTGLIRVVRSKEGKISPDIRGCAEGRGAYICPDPDCIERAFKKNGLERSFRTGIRADEKELIFKEIRELEREKSCRSDRDGD